MRHATLLLAALIGVSGLTACGGADPSNPNAAPDAGVAAIDAKARRITSTRASKSDDRPSTPGTSSGSTDGGAGSTSGSTSGGTSGGTSGSSTGGGVALVTAPPVGRLLASNCFACHGTNGRPAGGFDRLAGESAAEIYDELKEMAGKTDEGIMGVHARGYSDTQMWQLATYFSQQR